MDEYERLSRLSVEQLEAEIEWEQAAAWPRWLAWTVLALGIAGVAFTLWTI